MTDIVFLTAWLLFLTAMLIMWHRDSRRMNEMIDEHRRYIQQRLNKTEDQP